MDSASANYEIVQFTKRCQQGLFHACCWTAMLRQGTRSLKGSGALGGLSRKRVTMQIGFVGTGAGCSQNDVLHDFSTVPAVSHLVGIFFFKL